MKAKLVKESLNEYMEHRAEGMEPEELAYDTKKYMPYMLKMNPEFVNADEDGGEPMDDFDRWGLIYLESNFPGGLTVMVLEYDGKLFVKFYTDSVAFVRGDHNDEYTEWVEPDPIEEIDEDYFKEIVGDMREYYGLERHIEDGESDYPDEMVTGGY